MHLDNPKYNIQCIKLRLNRSIDYIDPFFFYDQKYTHAFDFVVALVARRRDKSLETVFAIELSFLLDEANILERTATLTVHANEMIGAPDLAQCGNEGSSVLYCNQFCN